MKRWGRYWGPLNDEFSDRDLSIVVGFLENIDYLKESQVILDIGCGTGNIVQYLQRLGKEAHGITFKDSEVKVARERGIQNVFLADMHELPFSDEVYDAFLMWDSLEHAQAPFVALCEAKRILKPNGRGLIYMPSQDWVECPYHQITLTIRQMRHLLKISGLGVLDVIDYGKEQALYKLIKA